jgi:ABC-type transport system substrate-binding protein
VPIRCALWFGRTAGGLVVAAAVLTAAAFASPGSTNRLEKEGGTLRVALPAGFLDTIDPVLVDFPAEVVLLHPACGSLVDYPAKALPEGGRLRPELAEMEPTVSRDGKRYTFTIRRDARFSNGAPVTARAFQRAVERLLDPAMKGFGAGDTAALILGGEDVLSGQTTTPRGVVARGRTLVLTLTRREPLFLEIVANLCAAPPSLAANPEGAKAPLPSAGPYYVAEYVPGERVALERNRFYRGARPHNVDRIVALDLSADPDDIVDDVLSGKVDWAFNVQALNARVGELRQRFGVNRSRFFVRPQNFLRMFTLNSSRPLFRNNPKLRQAVNFAVDRRALTGELGPLAGTATDQYLSPIQAGYRDKRIYPLTGPDVRRARALARGHTRSGKAVLYTRSDPLDVAHAQILRRNLKAIGLELEIVQFPGTLIFEKLLTERHLFDIGRVGWGHSPDPSWFAGIFDGRTIGRPGQHNWSYFNSAKYNRLFYEAARLRGVERERAYGELDAQLSREAAPAIPFANLNAPTLVSARVGCVVLNPWLDLTAVCLK